MDPRNKEILKVVLCFIVPLILINLVILADIYGWIGSNEEPMDRCDIVVFAVFMNVLGVMIGCHLAELVHPFMNPWPPKVVKNVKNGEK